MAMALIDRIEACRKPQAFYFVPPPDWAGEARKLLPFCKNEKPKWWLLAERILKEDFAVPAKAKRYNDLVTAPSYQGRKKAVFIDKIRGQFDTLADIHRVK